MATEQFDKVIERLVALIAELTQKTEPADVQKIDGSAITQPVSGPLTDTQLRATAVPVSGTVTASGPLTDTQLRAAAVPISAVSLPLPTGAPALTDSFKTRSDTYTVAGSGITIVVNDSPLTIFAVQVISTGTVATSWDVRLEGSLDNVNWSKILQHTNVTGNGEVVWSGALLSPSLYIRSRAAGLVLGAATDIVVKILGVR